MNLFYYENFWEMQVCKYSVVPQPSIDVGYYSPKLDGFWATYLKYLVIPNDQ